MQSQSLKTLSIFACLLGTTTLANAESVTVYGKAHISTDYIMFTDSNDIAVGSNSSRIGFKGEKKVEHSLTAFWKYENEIDLTAESKPLSARNRYVGLKSNFGSVLAGYHDTPFKSFGGKAGVFHDTIGERRGILGAGNGSNKMNIRAKNSVMYTSPSLYGLTIKALASTGDDSDKAFDANGVMSFSAVYTRDNYYAGVAYEDQTKLSATEATGLRVGAGAKFGSTALNLMYEDLKSDTKDAFSRAAYGGSLTHSINKLTLKAQLFMSQDYNNMADSNAMLYAVGAAYKLDKKVEIYALYAAANNEANANVVLAGSGHGEKYSPAAAGDDLSGVSAGMVYKF